MTILRIILLATVIALTLTLPRIDAFAQCSTTVVAGLRAPVKSVLSPAGSLFVAEAGTGPNTGRISVIDRSGTRRTLIDNLPSGLSPEGISGPGGIDLRGRTLYVTIGEGDTVIAGPIPGSQLPNPAPSSPLFSSVLAIRLGGDVEQITESFALTTALQAELKTGARRTLTAANGQSLTVEVVADFRNFTFEPRPGLVDNVRASNPFGVAVANGKTLYVADAGQNLVREVDIKTGDNSVLARFAPKPNPLPFGGPFVEAVPDNVRLFGKQLLVPLLTGFPFAPGVAEIRKINRANDSQSTFIGGLTSAIDVLAVKTTDGQDQFFTLEFTTNLLAQPLPPGRLKLFASASAQPVTLADCLVSPSSLSFDQQTRTIFITETFTGRVVSVQVP